MPSLFTTYNCDKKFRLNSCISGKNNTMKKKLLTISTSAFSIIKFSNCQIFKLKIRLFIIGILVLHQISTFAQDSSHIKISLLTCTPGAELYSTFGHTAIRITDSTSLTDYVFNYGTFNFNDPGFYTKFIRGKLMYYLSTENFQSDENNIGFRDQYKLENRGITEQVLNLTANEKTTLMHAIYNNAKDENKFYKYDFFLDNCTTRTRDMLMKYKARQPDFKPVMPAGTRFRQAIHQYLDLNNKYWSKLGIDLLLGAPTDAVMTTAQSQFLPDNLMISFDSSNSNHQLILSSTNLYPVAREDNKSSFFTPMIVFSLLLIVIVGFSFSTNKWVKQFLQGFDGLFFLFTGAMGILLVFMWAGTDHSMTKNNYNLLWAWPINVIAAFFVTSKNKWASKYFGLCALLLTLVLLSWFFLPQQLNKALIPIVLLLIFRSARKYIAPVY